MTHTSAADTPGPTRFLPFGSQSEPPPTWLEQVAGFGIFSAVAGTAWAVSNAVMGLQFFVTSRSGQSIGRGITPLEKVYTGELAQFLFVSATVSGLSAALGIVTVITRRFWTGLWVGAVALKIACLAGTWYIAGLVYTHVPELYQVPFLHIESPETRSVPQAYTNFLTSYMWESGYLLLLAAACLWLRLRRKMPKSPAAASISWRVVSLISIGYSSLCVALWQAVECGLVLPFYLQVVTTRDARPNSPIQFYGSMLVCVAAVAAGLYLIYAAAVTIRRPLSSRRTNMRFVGTMLVVAAVYLVSELSILLPGPGSASVRSKHFLIFLPTAAGSLAKLAAWPILLGASMLIFRVGSNRERVTDGFNVNPPPVI